MMVDVVTIYIRTSRRDECLIFCLVGVDGMYKKMCRGPLGLITGGERFLR